VTTALVESRNHTSGSGRNGEKRGVARQAGALTKGSLGEDAGIGRQAERSNLRNQPIARVVLHHPGVQRLRTSRHKASVETAIYAGQPGIRSTAFQWRVAAYWRTIRSACKAFARKLPPRGNGSTARRGPNLGVPVYLKDNDSSDYAIVRVAAAIPAR
jgi:hypothetical protein